MMTSNVKLSAPFEVVELSKIANYKNFSDLFDGYPTFINRKKTLRPTCSRFQRQSRKKVQMNLKGFRSILRIVSVAKNFI